MSALAAIRSRLAELLELVDGMIEAPAAPVPAPPHAGPPAMAWGARVSSTFRDRVRWLAEDLDIGPAPGKPEPSWPMAVMGFETGRRFTADVKNPHSSATGLIQFMRKTAEEDLGTTTAKLAAMTAEDQLNFVWKYLRNRIRERGPIRSLADCYMAVLNPVAMGKPESYAMWVKGSSAYAVNAGLDANKDHVITKAEAAAKVHAMLAEGLRPENVA